MSDLVEFDFEQLPKPVEPGQECVRYKNVLFFCTFCVTLDLINLLI